jgi:hypothetical protein
LGFYRLRLLAGVSGLGATEAAAQTQPRPAVKGRYKLKIDSSPQQAAVYWDSSAAQQPKLYGIAGYTPITIKVPKGAVKIVLELSGFKPFEQVLDVRKNTSHHADAGAGAAHGELTCSRAPTARRRRR